MTTGARTRLFVPIILVAVLTPNVRATFHLMQIEQVIAGVNGDTTAQAIQLRMRANFQNLLGGARVRVWDAAGMNPIVVSDPAMNVLGQSLGMTVLLATPGFSAVTTPAAVPDFVMTAPIPPSYLAAGSLTFENNTGALIYWRLSWGGASYTGPGNGELTNDADGNFNPPFAGPLPSTGLQALQFQGTASAMSTDNAADYALTPGAATFINNNGQVILVDPPPIPGACCDAVRRVCSEGVTQQDCEAQGGTFGGENSACLDFAKPCVTASIGLEPVATGLISPVSVTHANDGSGRLFIVDQGGFIRVVDAAGNLLATPFLDLTSKIVPLDAGFDERGVLGLAFHPDFATNGRFFVRYSAPRTVPPDPSEPCAGTPRGCHREVLAEYAVSAGDPNVADAASETILFSIDEPQFNHDAGHVAFGPDGLLYFTLGDGGGANDGLADVPPSHGPIGNGQNIETALGAMLRIDVDSQPDPGLAYAIPADNPFVGIAGLDEIYAYGLRNPFSFSFDDGPGGTNDLYVADVGQALFEEVDVVVKGGNYGWVLREGLHCFDPLDPTNPPDICTPVGAGGEPLIDPVSEYSHARGGLSVIGGFVYRGAAIPTLTGRYLYGDFSADFGPSGRLYYFDTTGPDAFIRHEFHITPNDDPLGLFVKGFGEDEDGEVYVCASNELAPTGSTGVILRIVAPTAGAPNRDASRYVTIIPPQSPDPIGLAVTCVGGSTKLVGPPSGNPDNIALLVDDPLDAAFLTSAEWGAAVHVTGMGVDIAPDSDYSVHVNVGSVGSTTLSNGVLTRTAVFGDVTGTGGGPPDGSANFVDINGTVLAFQESVLAPPLYRADVIGSSVCGPNGTVNFQDISTVVGAFQEAPNACAGPCP